MSQELFSLWKSHSPCGKKNSIIFLIKAAVWIFFFFYLKVSWFNPCCGICIETKEAWEIMIASLMKCVYCGILLRFFFLLFLTNMACFWYGWGFLAYLAFVGKFWLKSFITLRASTGGAARIRAAVWKLRSIERKRNEMRSVFAFSLQ